MPSFITPGGKDEYSKWVGFIYIFNLIVGTGALTLPSAFSKAGWLISIFVVSALAFISYVTVTFVVESMATTNAILHWRKLKQSQNSEYELPESGNSDDTSQILDESEKDHENTAAECEPLLENSIPHRLPMPVDYYSITEKVELGQMMSLYFKCFGVTVFYLCVSIYLYGDLAIYAAAVAKSLRDVTCTYSPGHDFPCNKSLNLSMQCWPGSNITRSEAYRLYIVVFLFLLGPFVFFNVQKTKQLQILTTFLRWLAFISMIVLTTIQLGKGRGEGRPKLANAENIPELFGICVYSFMCHHSLPSLVTPVNDKRKIHSFFAADYFLILCFYILLSMTGVFTFESLYDLYTLNFQPDRCNPDNPNAVVNIAALQYFLALFPVFTLSTNFPIIGITLRNNLQVLLLKENSNKLLRHMALPLITILPPIVIALLTERVDGLVSFTGSYAGAGIQYIVPVYLVYRSRKLAGQVLDVGIKNSHASIFRHNCWLIFVTVWAITCIALVTANNIIKIVNS